MTNNTQSAVAAAMAEVKRIERDSENRHGNYRYASADAVFDTLRPVLAKHGLEIHCSETEFGVEERQGDRGPKLWATARYELRLGDSEPETRTVYGWLTGPQTAGALATYAVKYWLRTKLLLNTGEPDADAEPKHAPPPNGPNTHTAAGAHPEDQPKLATKAQIARIRQYAASPLVKTHTRDHLLAKLDVNALSAAAAGAMIRKLEENVGVLVHSTQSDTLTKLRQEAEALGLDDAVELLATALADKGLKADAAKSVIAKVADRLADAGRKEAA